MRKEIYILAIFIFLISFLGREIFNFNNKVFAADITATVKIGLCGDEIIDTSEQCDGVNLGGTSCVSRGFSSGTLDCDPSCEFDTSGCIITPTPLPLTIVTPSFSSSRNSILKFFFPTILPITPLINSDFNNDGKIDITDLSVLLYWFDRTGPKTAKYDLNNDNIVDMVDVSILFYYWNK